ncbi:hypothetical protein Hanom_Chr12g01147861 [Helianthus anomalus]
MTLFCCLKCGTSILQNRPTYDETTKDSFRNKEFNNHMQTVLKIIWARHFYVVCFNIKHSTIDVLDNNAVEDKVNI